MDKINCNNVIIITVIAVILIVAFFFTRSEGFSGGISTCQLDNNYCSQLKNIYLEPSNEQYKVNRYTEQEDAVKYNAFDDLLE